jgi:hypothetical protein
MRPAQTQTLAATAAADQSYSVFFVFDGEEDVSAFETFLVLLQKTSSWTCTRESLELRSSLFQVDSAIIVDARRRHGGRKDKR